MTTAYGGGSSMALSSACWTTSGIASASHTTKARREARSGRSWMVCQSHSICSMRMSVPSGHTWTMSGWTSPGPRSGTPQSSPASRRAAASAWPPAGPVMR